MLIQRGSTLSHDPASPKLLWPHTWPHWLASWSDKARSNLEKHGVSFEEASSVFLDPYFLATDDPAAPDRFIALGFSRLVRLLFVVHLERGEKVRIISARRASRSERKTYEQRRNDPG